MKSNKKYFLFPKPHRNHLLFLFYFASSMVKQYILKSKKKEDDNLSNPILKLYVNNLGDFMSFIPYLILRQKIKSYNNRESKNNKYKNKGHFKLIFSNIFDKMKKRIIFNLFIISLLDFISQTSTTIFYLLGGDQNMKIKHVNLNIVLIFHIFFLFFLTKFLLDLEFYLHHYFSLILFIICLIVIAIIDFNETTPEKKDFIDSLLYIVIRIFAVLLNSLVHNLAKIIFIKNYLSPYLLVLIEAIFQFIYLIIFSIPLFVIKFKDEKGEEKIIFSMFSNIFKDKIVILLYIIYMISSFFYNILNYLIIDKFSPTHTAIAFISSNFGIFLIDSILKSFGIDYKFGIRLVMYILLIFASLIFNEFLVINICGLANGTKLFLDYKEQKDLFLINEAFNEDNENDNIFDINNKENIRTFSLNDSINDIELTEL